VLAMKDCHRSTGNAARLQETKNAVAVVVFTLDSIPERVKPMNGRKQKKRPSPGNRQGIGKKSRWGRTRALLVLDGPAKSPAPTHTIPAGDHAMRAIVCQAVRRRSFFLQQIRRGRKLRPRRGGVRTSEKHAGRERRREGSKIKESGCYTQTRALRVGTSVVNNQRALTTTARSYSQLGPGGVTGR